MGWYAEVSLPCSNANVERETNGQMKIVPHQQYPDSMCEIHFTHEGKDFHLVECNGTDFLLGIVMRVGTLEETDAFQAFCKEQWGDEFYFCEDDE